MRYQVTIAIAAVFNQDGKLLVSLRRDPEFIGADNKWDLVGGLIDFGENPDETIVREIKEESGLNVQVVSLLSKVFVNVWKKTNGDEQHTNIIAYVCKVVSGELKPDYSEPKLGDMKFIDVEDLKNYDTLPCVYEIVELALVKA